MYRLSLRQVILLSFFSALMAGAMVAVYDRYWHLAEPVAGAKVSGAEPVTNSAPPASNPLSADDENNNQVYRTAGPGVVNITSISYVEDFFSYGAYPQQGSGSGSIIDKKGHILTNYHVVKEARDLKVTLADKSGYNARLVGADPDNDLAVIKIDAPAEKLHAIALGSSQDLQVGQKVLAIGNPFGLDRTLTRGIISGLGRPLKGTNNHTIENVIQTDASINPGNSGGPLLNSNGEMIGINTAIYSPTGGSVGIGFAVPVDIAKRILPDLIANGRVLRPWLGVATSQVTPQLATMLNLGTDEGLIITGVLPDGPADKAGIVGSKRISVNNDNRYSIEADVLTKVDGQQIRNDDDLYRILNNHKTDDTVKVEIFRNGRPMQLNVRLEPKPKILNR